MNDQYLKTKQSQTEELKGRAPRHPTIRAIGPNHPLSMLPPPPPPPPRENSVADVASRDVDVDVDMDVDDVSKDSPSKNTGVSSFYLDKFESVMMTDEAISWINMPLYEGKKHNYTPFQLF